MNIREQEKTQMEDKLGSCLSKCSGVIHVGASIGQEREFYHQLDIDVIWIEPLPTTFVTLQENIQPYPKQLAYQYLITDNDGDDVTFHVYSHVDREIGAQSSIFQFARSNHPKIRHREDIVLTSTTLPTMLHDVGVDITKYDALVMDTQGSEMLVLTGAEKMLQQFQYICSEASVNGGQYTNSCRLDDINKLLSHHGFKNIYEHSHTPGVHLELDVIYERHGAV